MAKKSQAEQVAKECVIMHLPTKRLMRYDEQTETLYYDPTGFTVFPSKQKGISARHHAIEKLKAQGIVEEWREIYQVIET